MKYDIFLESFKQFIQDCPEETLDSSIPYVFFSDLHMGNGSAGDDLEKNRRLLETALEQWYLPRGFCLVLNGDIEDTNKFPLASIQKAWPKLLSLFDSFHQLGRLRKIVGNHDYELLMEKGYPWPLLEGLVFCIGENRLFVFHGHQGSTLYVKFNSISGFLVRYFLRPLHIRNIRVAHDSRRRFRTEKRIYRAARHLGVPVITGHTHRPLFESLSKYDTIRMALEGLLSRYCDADESQKDGIEENIKRYRDELRRLASEKEKTRKTQSLYGGDPFLIPCIFNSGCATGKHGSTALEIYQGEISLVYWTAREESRLYARNEELLGDRLDGGVYRHVLQKDRLDRLFTRIRFLGETGQ